MPTDESQSKCRTRRRRVWPVPEPQVGRWRSAAGFEGYRAAYEEVLASVPAPTRTHDVLTDYDSVRVYEWEGPAERAPVSPRTLTDRGWRTITASVPSRVDIAGQKSLTGGEDAAARARALGFEHVTVWPRATHSLPMQMRAELDPELARWWAAHD